jgi:acetyl esterase/lipase
VAVIALPQLLSPASLINAFAPGARVRFIGGLSYGQGLRRKLDVYSPAFRSRNAPVIVFFYGGGWEDGDRGFYRFAAAALAERGIVTVVPDYRLYPEVRFPAFLHDGAEAVGWVRSHAGEFGGDPRRIFLMGHSAGAYIAAMLALDPQWQVDDLRGIIGLAGPYDFLPLHSDVLREIFGPTETLGQTQPINFVNPAAPPMLLLHGARDRIVLPRNSTRLTARLREAGCVAEDRIYPLIGHKLLVAALARPFRLLAPVLRDCTDFIRRMETPT